MPNTGERESIINCKLHKAYVAYRRKYGVKKGVKAQDRTELFKISMCIFKHMAKYITESSGGLVIKGWGYFFAWLIPKKMTYRQITRNQPSREKFNLHTNQRIYTLVFLAKKGGAFWPWSMDGKFTVPIKQRLKERILNGFRPKGFPYSIQNFL